MRNRKAVPAEAIFPWKIWFLVMCFMALSSPVQAAASITADDLNGIMPEAGPVDAATSALGMRMADYRVDSHDAAASLLEFMRENPDHEITRKYASLLSYGDKIGMDSNDVLAGAIAEARKNLYVTPGMTTLYASTRIFDEIAAELSATGFKYMGVAVAAALVLLLGLLSAIRGGVRAMLPGRQMRRHPA